MKALTILITVFLFGCNTVEKEFTPYKINIIEGLQKENKELRESNMELLKFKFSVLNDSTRIIAPKNYFIKLYNNSEESKVAIKAELDTLPNVKFTKTQLKMFNQTLQYTLLHEKQLLYKDLIMGKINY